MQAGSEDPQEDPVWEVSTADTALPQAGGCSLRQVLTLSSLTYIPTTMVGKRPA